MKKKIKGNISILYFLFALLPKSLVSFLLSVSLSTSLFPFSPFIQPSVAVCLSPVFLNMSLKIPKEEANLADQLWTGGGVIP